MRSRFLLFFLQDSFEHVTRLGDMRQIYLGFGRSISPRGGGSAGFATLKVSTHTFGLVGLQRTGVGLLLGNSHGFKNIKNRLALDFQFTC